VGLVMLLVLGLLAAIAVPSFVSARERAMRTACINNLRQIDGAKDQYMLIHRAEPTGMGDLVGEQFLRDHPACPTGGTYSLGAIGEDPTCSIPGHELPSSVLAPIHPAPARRVPALPDPDSEASPLRERPIPRP